MYDIRDKPEALPAKDPLWKVAPIITDLCKNCEGCWVTGKCVAIDEQTIGFNEKHGFALCINYKNKAMDTNEMHFAKMGTHSHSISVMVTFQRFQIGLDI